MQWKPVIFYWNGLKKVKIGEKNLSLCKEHSQHKIYNSCRRKGGNTSISRNPETPLRYRITRCIEYLDCDSEIHFRSAKERPLACVETVSKELA